MTELQTDAGERRRGGSQRCGAAMQSMNDVLQDLQVDALSTDEMLHRLRQHFWRLQREAREAGMDDMLARIEGDPEAIRSTYYQIALTTAITTGPRATATERRGL